MLIIRFMGAGVGRLQNFEGNSRDFNVHVTLILKK